MNQEDTLLVQNAKEESADFAVLYDKYAPKVFNYFWYRVGQDRDVAEDLMQETFISAFENLSKFRVRGYSYLTYLITIAHNLLVNHFRKPKNLPLDHAEIVPLETMGDIEDKLQAENLWRAVEDLNAAERDVLLMHYQMDMPVKDIAVASNRTENAVKLSLSRSRKRLRAHPRVADIGLYRDVKKKRTAPRFMEKR